MANQSEERPEREEQMCLYFIPPTQPLLSEHDSPAPIRPIRNGAALSQDSASYRQSERADKKRGASSNMHINSLSRDIVLRIFSHLDVVSLCRSASVCQLWCELAMDGSNWQRIDLFEYQINIKTSVMKPISRRCGGFLRALSLRSCKNVEDDSLRSLTKYCPNLEELDLNGCIAITDSVGFYLSERCVKLRRLDLRSCTRITDATLHHLGLGCPLLESVFLSYCSKLTNGGLLKLVQRCHSIHTLYLDYCLSIDDTGLKHIAAHCPLLSKLSVTFCKRVTDVGVRAVAENCDLRFISLSHCDVSNSALQALGQFCTHLNSLAVSNCVRLTDTGFQGLCQGCRELEHLDMEECVLISDITLTSLARYCSRIKSLTLSACDQITDDGILALTAGEAASETLQILELDNCPLLTDTSIDHLIYCAPLIKVYLYDCQQISRAGVDKLKSSLPALKVQAYFAPLVAPPLPSQGRAARFFRGCRHCEIL